MKALFCFYFFVISPLFVYATDYFFSPDGTEYILSSCISSANPCNIVSLSSLSPADIGYLSPGVYDPWDWVISINPCTIIGAGPNLTFLRSNSKMASSFFALQTGLISIQNLTFDGCPENTQFSGSILSSFGTATFSNVHFENIACSTPTTRNPISLFPGSNTIFSNCVFKNITIPNSGSSFVLTAAYTFFTGCYFYDNSIGSNLVLSSAPIDFYQTTFELNVVGQAPVISQNGTVGMNYVQFLTNTGLRTGALLLESPFSSSLISNSIFQYNTGGLLGGAIQFGPSLTYLSIINCTFLQNYMNIPAGAGGAIYSESNLIIDSSTFISHSISSYTVGRTTFYGVGGAIFVSDSATSFSISRSTINNGTVENYGYGAAIFSAALFTEILDCFIGPSLIGYGAVSFDAVGNVSISNTPIAAFPLDISMKSTNINFLTPLNLTNMHGISSNTIRTYGDLRINSLYSDLFYLTIDNNSTMTIVDSWFLTSSSSLTMFLNGNLVLLSTCTADWQVNVYFNGPGTFYNYGTLNSIIFDSEGSNLNLGVPFYNYGFFSVLPFDGSKLSGIGPFYQYGTFKVAGCDIVVPIFFESQSTLIVTYTAPGFLSGLKDLPSGTNFNGSLDIDRVYPSWPTSGESLRFIHFSYPVGPDPPFPSNQINKLNASTWINSYDNFIYLNVTDAPFIVNNDDYTAEEDTSIEFNPLENDFVSGGFILIVSVSDSNRLSWDARENMMTYSPIQDNDQTETFTYTAQYLNQQVTGTITIKINPVNDPPIYPGDQTFDFNKKKSSFTLAGEDIDSQLQYLVEFLPQYGKLYLSDGTLITKPNTVLSDPNLIYEFDNPDQIGVDDIFYYLIDENYIIPQCDVDCGIQVKFVYNSPSSQLALIVGVSAGVGGFCLLLLVILLIFGFYVWRTSRYISLLNTEFIREISQLEGPFEDFVKIGEGQGGDVFVAVCEGAKYALKSLKLTSTEAAEDFRKECEALSQLQHPNIVRFWGVYLTPEAEYMVLEYMECGSLLSYLGKREGGFTEEELYYLCFGVAQGMFALEKRKFVHRDLACRNLLVNKVLEVKISDFGLTRKVNDETGGFPEETKRPIPIRWTAPEVWNQRIYYLKSDVWSFAVTSCEIFGLGKQPFAGTSNAQLPAALEGGLRPTKPDLMPQRLYAILEDCWDLSQADRPSFSQLLPKMRSLAKKKKYPMLAKLAQQKDDLEEDEELYLPYGTNTTASQPKFKSISTKNLSNTTISSQPTSKPYSNPENKPYSNPESTGKAYSNPEDSNTRSETYEFSPSQASPSYVPADHTPYSAPEENPKPVSKQPSQLYLFSPTNENPPIVKISAPSSSTDSPSSTDNSSSNDSTSSESE